MIEDSTSQVMIQTGMFENRVVHTTKAHPQIGWINYEGERRKVHVGFWNDCPVWKVAKDDNDPEYLYCAEKAVDIEDNEEDCLDEVFNPWLVSPKSHETPCLEGQGLVPHSESGDERLHDRQPTD